MVVERCDDTTLFLYLRILLLLTLVMEIYISANFATFLDPSIYVVTLYEIVEGG